MSPEKLALGLMIVALGIGLLGNLSASFLWWFYTTDRERRKRAGKRPYFIGAIGLVGFFLLFFLGFVIFKSVV